MFKAEIFFPDKKVRKIFEAEDKNLGRASYIIKENNKNIIFKIKAEDISSLRAALNSITKTLDVYEKTKNVK
ncbi:CTAG/PCC1 family protein [Candidatus Woesearchaeota archaeon]|nr:CTAG/PCC1 family protein [Candidatus Woesearchaeota archaeon]